MISIRTPRPIFTDFDQTSIWNAAVNPIVYKLRREDYEFDSVNDNSGFVQMQFDGVDLSDLFTIGDSVYIESANFTYHTLATVTAVSFSTNTLVTLDYAYDGSAFSGGFVNNLTTIQGYKAYINVYDGNDTLLTQEPFSVSPDYTGIMYADISVLPMSFG